MNVKFMIKVLIYQNYEKNVIIKHMLRETIKKTIYFTN